MTFWESWDRDRERIEELERVVDAAREWQECRDGPSDEKLAYALRDLDEPVGKPYGFGWQHPRYDLDEEQPTTDALEIMRHRYPGIDKEQPLCWGICRKCNQKYDVAKGHECEEQPKRYGNVATGAFVLGELPPKPQPERTPHGDVGIWLTSEVHEALLADKARLDWLEEDEMLYCLVWKGDQTLRQAIDAAKEQGDG